MNNVPLVLQWKAFDFLHNFTIPIVIRATKIYRTFEDRFKVSGNALINGLSYCPVGAVLYANGKMVDRKPLPAWDCMFRAHFAFGS